MTPKVGWLIGIEIFPTFPKTLRSYLYSYLSKKNCYVSSKLSSFFLGLMGPGVSDSRGVCEDRQSLNHQVAVRNGKSWGNLSVNQLRAMKIFRCQKSHQAVHIILNKVGGKTHPCLTLYVERIVN